MQVHWVHWRREKPASILMSAKSVCTVVISMHAATTTKDRTRVSANAARKETAFKSALSVMSAFWGRIVVMKMQSVLIWRIDGPLGIICDLRWVLATVSGVIREVFALSSFGALLFDLDSYC